MQDEHEMSLFPLAKKLGEFNCKEFTKEVEISASHMTIGQKTVTDLNYHGILRDLVSKLIYSK